MDTQKQTSFLTRLFLFLINIMKDHKSAKNVRVSDKQNFIIYIEIVLCQSFDRSVFQTVLKSIKTFYNILQLDQN